MKITYKDKEDLINLPDIPEINKITASDMNQIKKAINYNNDELEKVSSSMTDFISSGISGVPIGTILQWNGNVIPTGYLKLDGQSLSVNDYPDLYNIIGNTYGGNSSTFNLSNQNTGSELIDASAIPSYYYIIRAK